MGLYDDNDSEVVRVGGGWAAASQQVFFKPLCWFGNFESYYQSIFLIS